jgi:hypothetical protein
MLPAMLWSRSRKESHYFGGAATRCGFDEFKPDVQHTVVGLSKCHKLLKVLTYPHQFYTYRSVPVVKFAYTYVT